MISFHGFLNHVLFWMYPKKNVIISNFMNNLHQIIIKFITWILVNLSIYLLLFVLSILSVFAVFLTGIFVQILLGSTVYELIFSTISAVLFSIFLIHDAQVSFFSKTRTDNESN